MNNKAKETTPQFQQLNLSDIIEMLNDPKTILSSSELKIAVDKLQEAQQKAERREREEIRRKEQEERARKAKEEQKRREEHIQKVTCMDLPLDWENAFNSDARAQGVHTDSIPDGLIMSLTTLGKVDIEYISSITGAEYKEVISTLKGSIYQNPETWDECFYKGWETADEYLSGNLMRKWKAANIANEEYNGYFSDNIKAIETVLPPTVATKDIYVTLGSPWVPADIIDDFIAHLFSRSGYYSDDYYCVKHDELTGTWDVPAKNRYDHNVTSSKTYGTDRMEALYILEKTLNMKSVAVTDEVKCPTNASGKKRVINKEETLLAIEKQQKMIKEFQKWVWQDENRKERLETIFENNFSCVRRRIFDGSFLAFPTMSQEVQLYPYQKNAVARILFSANTLLAHDVGSGKTYVMIAAGMELRRMGLSKKNLYVVPNNIVGQWKSIFLTMYPNADILTVEPKNFTPAKREAMLKKIRDEEHDGIIMAYSCFEQIPLSRKFYFDSLYDTQARIKKLEEDAKKRTSRLMKQKEKIAKELAELTATLNMLSSDIYFDELGVTRLFVDEAHNYKNVPVETKADKVLGISSGGSKKCEDMLNKVRTVQKDGGGVIMATGTPITNSITDAFIMQKYLQNGELGLLDLQSFDSWIGMFAERVTEFEVDVDTSSYRLATRFAKFHNLPELTSLFAQVADFHRLDKNNGIPQLDEYSDALIAKTQDFADYLKQISNRADAVRHGRVSRTMDNMLMITTDGRKAALDMRLVSPGTGFTYQSKAARCAENVFGIYQKTADRKSTQLIFCDSSTPKAGFNLYDELKRLLVNMGVLSEQIAYVHDAETEAKRSKLFAMVRNGNIRILIGSTFKLGLGVNVQDKLIAVHHLDVPWRPADMTQREGRILRQGNENPKVQIYRYITEGSFDAYSWQLLETKQRFITGLLSGSYTERSGTDIDDTVLSYAEVKALAVGDPLVKRRIETANELSRYLTLQRKLVDTRIRLEKELMEFPTRIMKQEQVIENALSDRQHYKYFKLVHPIPVTNAEKQAETKERRLLREQLFGAIKKNDLKPTESKLTEYCGFDIIVPANMQKEKPYIWLKRRGRYYVELGDTELGGLIRIDHFLDHFDEHIQKLRENLAKMKERQKNICEELEKNESYAEQIEQLRKELERIDRKLGVDKK